MTPKEKMINLYFELSDKALFLEHEAKKLNELVSYMRKIQGELPKIYNKDHALENDITLLASFVDELDAMTDDLYAIKAKYNVRNGDWFEKARASVKAAAERKIRKDGDC